MDLIKKAYLDKDVFKTCTIFRKEIAVPVVVVAKQKETVNMVQFFSSRHTVWLQLQTKKQKRTW